MIVDPDFFEHWRTRMLVDALGGDQMAPMYVMRIWAHCQSRRATSFNMPAAGLRALCRFNGDAELLESSLAEAGFIQRNGAAIAAPTWAEYNAKLMANWKNGATGGRPKASEEEPTDNPRITQQEPTKTQSEPTGTHAYPIREDKSREEKKGKSKAEAAPPSALPDWMPLDSWSGYLEMRKKIKKAPTDRAVALLIASLGKMRDDGQDIAAVLDKSIKNNWTDVYPIREAQQTRAPPPQDPRFFGLAGLDRTGDQLAMDASMKRHGVVVGDDDDLSFDLPGRQNETNE